MQKGFWWLYTRLYVAPFKSQNLNLPPSAAASSGRSSIKPITSIFINVMSIHARRERLRPRGQTLARRIGPRPVCT